jgi:hypothetical protein
VAIFLIPRYPSSRFSSKKGLRMKKRNMIAITCYYSLSFLCGVPPSSQPLIFSSHSTAPEKLVISLEEYDELNTPSIPTVLSYTSPEHQLLVYIGTCHDTNLKNSQYTILDKNWRSFLERTHGQHITIISETLGGDLSHADYVTKAEAISSGADCGYATWLGKTHNIPVIGAELSHKAVIQQLLKEFDKDEVYYFCFAMAADFWTRYEEKPTLEPFILDRVRKWTDNPAITFKHLTALHELYTGKAFTTPNKNFFIRLMTLTYHTSYLQRALTYFSIPASVLTIIYPILRRSHQIRDAHTLGIISDNWKAGKHLFIIYGALHAIALKKHLEKLTQH